MRDLDDGARVLAADDDGKPLDGHGPGKVIDSSLEMRPVRVYRVQWEDGSDGSYTREELLSLEATPWWQKP